MGINRLRLASVLFLAANACFLLPFADLTTATGAQTETLTGLRLLLGARLDYATIEPNPYVTVAAFSAAIAFVLSLSPNAKGMIWSALVAIPGAAGLFFVESSLDTASITISLEPAFYLTQFFLVAAAAAGLLGVWSLVRVPISATSTPFSLLAARSRRRLRR